MYKFWCTFDWELVRHKFEHNSNRSRQPVKCNKCAYQGIAVLDFDGCPSGAYWTKASFMNEAKWGTCSGRIQQLTQYSYTRQQRLVRKGNWLSASQLSHANRRGRVKLVDMSSGKSAWWSVAVCLQHCVSLSTSRRAHVYPNNSNSSLCRTLIIEWITLIIRHPVPSLLGISARRNRFSLSRDQARWCVWLDVPLPAKDRSMRNGLWVDGNGASILHIDRLGWMKNKVKAALEKRATSMRRPAAAAWTRGWGQAWAVSALASTWIASIVLGSRAAVACVVNASSLWVYHPKPWNQVNSTFQKSGTKIFFSSIRLLFVISLIQNIFIFQLKMVRTRMDLLLFLTFILLL